jgi:hypothetical protein
MESKAKESFIKMPVTVITKLEEVQVEIAG